ncbi:MAG: thioredoxin family protein [Bacteroidia bacterium]|nr:thioredoxin family protein [Bacteroidia bacterium]
MKHRLLTVLALLLLILSVASAQTGVTFYEGSWADALATARQQRKLIFVDAYTTWCGPCKMMNRNTFPDEAVGELFNQNFVNVKLDMEKGEGLTFASRYAVNAYPTMLFINHKGEVVHKILGYRAPKELLKEARVALSPENSIDALELAFQQGTTDRDTLLMIAMTWHDKEDRRAYDAGDRFFKTISNDKELLQSDNWKAIEALTYDLNSREYQYLLAKQKKFIKKYGYQPVLDKIYSLLKKAALSSAIMRNNKAYDQALQIANTQIKDDGRTAIRLQMTYTEAAKDWDGYAARSAEYFDRFIITQPKELSNAASLFYLHVANEEMLEKALGWTRQSIALENAGYNNLIQAQLLGKLSRKGEALKQAYRAKALLEQEEADLREVNALIEKLQ